MSKHSITTDVLTRLSQQVDEMRQLVERNLERLDKAQFHLDNAREAFTAFRKAESVEVSA